MVYMCCCVTCEKTYIYLYVLRANYREYKQGGMTTAMLTTNFGIEKRIEKDILAGVP